MWLRAAQWSHYREAARKNPTAVEHKGKSTGGRTEQASNIARGTPGSSVTCGIALSDSISCEMPSCSGAARLRGPWVAERPGVPRAPVFRGCADGDEGIRRARAAKNRAAFARLLRIRCRAQSATDTPFRPLAMTTKCQEHKKLRPRTRRCAYIRRHPLSVVVQNSGALRHQHRC